MKRSIAIAVLLVFVLTSFAFAGKKAAEKSTPTCDMKMAKECPMYANAKEKKEFAKNCKFICPKCAYYDKKAGECPTCKVKMEKCKNTDECRKMVMNKNFEKNAKFCCMNFGKVSDKAGKCPECGKKMKKVDKKNMEECKKACGMK